MKKSDADERFKIGAEKEYDVGKKRVRREKRTGVLQYAFQEFHMRFLNASYTSCAVI